jgi:hypothetical protein
MWTFLGKHVTLSKPSGPANSIMEWESCFTPFVAAFISYTSFSMKGEEVEGF